MEELCGEALLKTIKVPANLANLSSRLPKSNYQRTRGEDISLASLRNRDQTKTSSTRISQSLAEDTRVDRTSLLQSNLPRKSVKHNQSVANPEDSVRKSEYESVHPSSALPPRSLVHPGHNGRSVKNLVSGANSNIAQHYTNKLSALAKPVRASQDLPLKNEQQQLGHLN